MAIPLRKMVSGVKLGRFLEKVAGSRRGGGARIPGSGKPRVSPLRLAVKAALERRASGPANRKVLFESLEPRLLLSADPLLAYTATDEAELLLRAMDVDGVATIQLLDGQSVVESAELSGAGGEIRITGSSLDDRLTIGQGVLEVASLVVAFEGGEGLDTVAGPDGGAAWSVTGQGAGAAGNLSFHGVENIAGGTGEDTLKGPMADVEWLVSGADAGTVAGMTFSGMENLKGAAGNQDTFVIGGAGRISGLVDGGAGGYDSLVIADGADNVGYIATGPDSGRVVVGGTSTAFAGLEPVTVSGDGVGNVTITLDGNANDASLTYDSNAGMLALVSNITTGAGAFETFLFGAPVGKTLTINLGFGADQLDIADLTGKGAFALVVNDPEDVTLDADVLLDGSLTVKAGSAIAVADGVTIDVGGDILLEVDAGYALTWDAVTPVFQNLDAIGSIVVGAGSRLEGQNVTLRSHTSVAGVSP